MEVNFHYKYHNYDYSLIIEQLKNIDVFSVTFTQKSLRFLSKKNIFPELEILFPNIEFWFESDEYRFFYQANSFFTTKQYYFDYKIYEHEKYNEITKIKNLDYFILEKYPIIDYSKISDYLINLNVKNVIFDKDIIIFSKIDISEKLNSFFDCNIIPVKERDFYNWKINLISDEYAEIYNKNKERIEKLKRINEKNVN